MALRLAVVQQNHNPGKVEENRQKALGYAQEALRQGAELILFHEELLIGYDARVPELAEPVDGPTTQAFQELLQGSESLILYGLTERDGDRLYIAGTVVGAGGVVANYHKTHLWWAAPGLRHEPTLYTPGDRWVTFELKGHKSGIMICYDGDFPETARSYANLGCSLLFWLNNRGSRGYEEVKALARCNSLIMATACCCGVDEKGNVCRGGSNIVGPRGELLAELWDEEGVILADVEPEEVPALRAANTRYVGRRTDLYV